MEDVTTANFALTATFQRVSEIHTLLKVLLVFRVDDEEEPNDTDVSDDEEAELGSGYEIPTREEESIEVD